MLEKNTPKHLMIIMGIFQIGIFDEKTRIFGSPVPCGDYELDLQLPGSLGGLCWL